MHPKGADGHANNADFDQTAPKEHSDHGLHHLLGHTCPKTWEHYSLVQIGICLLSC